MNNYGFNFNPSTYSNTKGRTETSEERVRMEEVWIKSGNVYYAAIKAAFEYTIKKYSEEHPLFTVQHITDFRINRYLKNGQIQENLTRL